MSARRDTKVLVNRHLFTQTNVDSGSLTMLGVVVHRFPEPGEYMGVVERGRETRSFRLTVDEGSSVMQADIDLATLSGGHVHDADCGCHHKESAADRAFVVNPSGYVVFHVSSGPGGYAVRVGRLEKPDAAVFDSTRLEGDDLFAVTLIRPGRYSVKNVASGARGEIVVAYPTVGKKPRPPVDAVEIECTEKTLRPPKIKILAAQGQVYRFRAPSRIAIELVEPDDGPKSARPKRAAPRAARR
jgi:hypothetical protein